MDDEDLWRRSREGDGGAFGNLFDRHSSRVFRHACRLVDSRQDAEDVTAAAFLELWRRRSAVRLVDGSVLPWLLVTAGNLSLNTRRGSLRYRRFLARLPRVESAVDAAELALNHLIDPALGAALSGLDRVDRALVLLVGVEGFSLKESAAVLSITPAAAKSRYHRTRHEQ